MSRQSCGVAALAALLAAAGCGSSGATDQPRSAQVAATAAMHAALAVTQTSCVGDWHPVAAGPHQFVVTNRGTQPLQISFIAATSGDVFGKITQLDPATTRPLAVDAPAGSYRFRCVPRRGDATVSAAEPLSGAGGQSAAPLVPMSAEEIVSAVATYRHEVREGIDRLVPATDRLDSAVRHGRWSSARRWWLRAHVAFASLGAAYGTFGALTDKIDGRADGLTRGVHDPAFSGFLAVERLLWSRVPASVTKKATSVLDHDVHTLHRRFPHLTLIAGDLPLRAHEILENSLQFELTGDTDEGSHTNLATVRANVTGTRKVIDALTPALRQRRPRRLQTITAGLDQLSRALTDLRAARGGWPDIRRLSPPARERIDADVDGLLEQLAQIPGVLQLPASLALP